MDCYLLRPPGLLARVADCGFLLSSGLLWSRDPLLPCCCSLASVIGRADSTTNQESSNKSSWRLNSLGVHNSGRLRVREQSASLRVAHSRVSLESVVTVPLRVLVDCWFWNSYYNLNCRLAVSFVLFNALESLWVLASFCSLKCFWAKSQVTVNHLTIFESWICQHLSSLFLLRPLVKVHLFLVN